MSGQADYISYYHNRKYRGYRCSISSALFMTYDPNSIELERLRQQALAVSRLIIKQQGVGRTLAEHRELFRQEQVRPEE